MNKRDTVPIPQPPGLPILGNLRDIDINSPIQSLSRLVAEYGEIFCLKTLGERGVLVSSQKLVNEVCNEKRFGKIVKDELEMLRHGVGDGLFTAHDHEENWHIAHRVLVPAFGPMNIEGMFDDMKDIASQLVLKWARYGTHHKIAVTEDFTRLTMDTIALCAMDYRFNSFYSEGVHPFLPAMADFLFLAGARAYRPRFTSAFYRSSDKKWFKAINYMRTLSEEIVKTREQKPNGKKDLLDAMLNGKDPKTGKSLPRQNIIDNMITFLIAGHETTSGTLSFLFYYLVKNPKAYRKAQEEVDQIVGKQSIRFEHVNQLRFVHSCLRETLRLQPPVPGLGVTPKSDSGELLDGKYFVPKGESISMLLRDLHRDPAVYGEDAEEWKPERMTDEKFEKLPPNSWKPFGNGSRACIGRPFAWQEAVIMTAMLLQYFDFRFDDPQYELQIQSILTIKPDNLVLHASLRQGWTATKVEQHLSSSVDPGAERTIAERPGTALSLEKTTSGGMPLTVLYGSNSGTCEAFAQTLASDAAAHGYSADIRTLDSAKQNLPAKQPIVIVTASYEGEPCDNAAHFFEWLSNLKDEDKVEANFAVFGCGHSDWKQTFHRIPNMIDALLAKHGGTRICPKGSCDAAKGDMMSAFQEWEDTSFWPALKERFGDKDLEPETPIAAQSLEVDVSTSQRASKLRADVSEAKVLSVRRLTSPDTIEKKHMEIQLPSNMKFRAGDYMAILPLNPPETVHRVMIRFGLPWDAMLNISSKQMTTLPTDIPITAQNLFSAYVELSEPATKRNIAMLIGLTLNDSTKESLNKFIESDFNAEIVEKRVSLLDLLERFPDVQLPLGAFIASLIPMRVRQYSISSSPLADATAATLTYTVLDVPSTSGQGRHMGVASNYLSNLKAGDTVHVKVKPSHQSFHLPTDTETPVIMICAGTGLAPFRGFIQERAIQIAAGRKIAEAHLYVGCRHPDKDELYREELDSWERYGAVVVHRAYSQASEKTSGHRHIDDVLRADSDQLVALWEKGARVYVCGGRELGESVKQACLDISMESERKEGNEPSEEETKEWFESVRNERYSTDVFA